MIKQNLLFVFVATRGDRFKLRIFLVNVTSMEYLSYSSSDSDSDHEEIQDNADVQDYPELSLVDDLNASLRITERDGWYSF